MCSFFKNGVKYDKIDKRIWGFLYFINFNATFWHIINRIDALFWANSEMETLGMIFAHKSIVPRHTVMFKILLLDVTAVFN